MLERYILPLILIFSIFLEVRALNVECVECLPQLSLDNLQYLQGLSIPSRLKPNGKLLKPFLRKRVSGTENNTIVRDFIYSELESLDWKVELDSFESDTPYGKKKFSNVVAIKNPTARKSLVFAAHFDSKYFSPPNDNFVAATDSAVSCALLLDIAYSLNNLLETNMGNVTLKLIFFDGEEAFKEWSSEDSIYGARHLADKLHTTSLLNRIRTANLGENEIDSIELFVLLDLLGSEGTPLISINKESVHFFNKLIQLESKLFQYKLKPNSLRQRQFLNYQFDYKIDDDHRPFQEKGVSILHLIPVPFPKFWHTLGDNESVVSSKIVNHLALLFRAFIAEYLCLFNKE
ncbi:hypothetical protein K502DRAFT_306501 [Neoconidiobolus thromboides FSU 785]|nr:hypothetical protein K502DRAFT_306501 [Neoconidiobolus thromboides FSU 785]